MCKNSKKIKGTNIYSLGPDSDSLEEIRSYGTRREKSRDESLLLLLVLDLSLPAWRCGTSSITSVDERSSTGLLPARLFFRDDEAVEKFSLALETRS